MRRRARGFTLLEVIIALALLVTVIIASWSLLCSGQRNERFLWDEFAASELALSSLERATSADVLELTPNDGRPLVDALNPQLPELKVTLYVTPVAERKDLRDVRVTVAWTDNSTHIQRTLERAARKRVSP